MRPFPPVTAVPFLLLLLAVLLPLTRPADAAARLEPGEPLTEVFASNIIEAELRARGEGERFEVEVDNPALPLANPAARAAEVRLLDLRREPRGGRFTASLSIRLTSGESGTLALSGRARRLVPVAVPTRTVAPGEPLAATDLETRWLPEAQVAPDAAREPAELAGQGARRVLVAGRPVRSADVAAPRLVQRGDTVSLLYAGGGLELTTIGEALDTGGEGDTIRVRNADSGLVRKGFVVGRKAVRVAGPAEGAPW